MKCMHCGEESTTGNEMNFMHEHPKVCSHHDDVSVAEAAENFIRMHKGGSPWSKKKQPTGL